MISVLRGEYGVCESCARVNKLVALSAINNSRNTHSNVIRLCEDCAYSLGTKLINDRMLDDGK